MRERNFRPVVIISLIFIFFILSTALLSLIDTYFYSIDAIRFTPREQVTFDISQSLRTLQLFWVWLLGISVVGSIITYLISRSVLLSKIFLGLISLAAIGFAILAYWVSRQPCEGLGCMGIGFTLRLAEASWIIAGASVPILFLSALRKTENLLNNKTFYLIGILTLISISILWFLTTSHLRAESAKRVSAAKSAIQKIYSDPTFPVYEPTYLPLAVGTIGHEWTADREDSSEYIRWYQYGATKANNFEILETKPKVPKSNKEYLKEDLDKLKAKQSRFTGGEFYQYNPEVIIINGNSALVYTGHGLKGEVLPILQLYIGGVRVKISVNVASEQLSKEELIRIAESLTTDSVVIQDKANSNNVAEVPIKDSISYIIPEGWKEESTNSQFRIELSSPDFKPGIFGNADEGAGISIAKYKSTFSLEELKNNPSAGVKDITYTKIDGLDALRYREDYEGHYLVFHVIKDGYMLEIMISTPNLAIEDKYRTQFDAFLQSMRFKK